MMFCHPNNPSALTATANTVISDYNVNDEEPSKVCTTDEFTSAESLSLDSLFASSLLPAATFPQREKLREL